MQLAEIEPFDTLRSAGTKRDANNPFTLESDGKWHTYFHTQETAEIDAHVCDYYYQELNVPVHVYHGEDIYEQDNRSVEATLGEPRYYYRRLFWSVQCVRPMRYPRTGRQILSTRFVLWLTRLQSVTALCWC